SSRDAKCGRGASFQLVRPAVQTPCMAGACVNHRLQQKRTDAAATMRGDDVHLHWKTRPGWHGLPAYRTGADYFGVGGIDGHPKLRRITCRESIRHEQTARACFGIPRGTNDRGHFLVSDCGATHLAHIHLDSVTNPSDTLQS